MRKPETGKLRGTVDKQAGNAKRSSGANRGIRRRPLFVEALEGRAMMAAGDPFDVLIFSRTAAFRHDSIPAGIQAIRDLGSANNFTVTATEDPTTFTATGLERYEVVVFLNTTGDVLNSTQQGAFEDYIQAGGGWVGVHAAADTEYDWGWYGNLVGAYFQSHPAIQSGTVVVADKSFPATAGLPERWTRTDEWYNYRLNPRGKVHVLATLDERTYSGGSMGADHPIAWAQQYDGGRAFYTGLGHTAASYSEANFRKHLLGGLQWASGTVDGDAGATVNANYRLVPLDENTNNPMELAVADDGRVFYVERAGRIKVFHPDLGATRTVGVLSVSTSQEDGLLGIALDPNFSQNNWIYLYYSPPSNSENRVSRFTLSENNTLVAGSERILLRVATQRTNCCHSAGSLAFGPNGELYISTGDNTNPFASDGFAPIDERPGRSDWDAQKSSGNRNDLRGKILRIKPEDDGTYSIPEGNLFPADGSDGRPEVYVMGNRNPFRISVDQETGWLYWGEVGPDAGSNSASRGPMGYDEFNQARQAGNFGWPYFVGNNFAYNDYNFATGASGPRFDPNAPINDSPNNRGSQNLPPTQAPLIWYPYGNSTEFPEMGTGGRTAMGGPVYHFQDVPGSNVELPEYYDDTLFIYEWSRNWIKEVKLDSNGRVLKINSFLPNLNLKRPMDMTIGPDGAIYMLEWGTDFGGGNADSRLIKIEYIRKENPPSAVANADVLSGALPLVVQFDGTGSNSGDAPPLTYAWDFNGDGVTDSTESKPSFTYTVAGNYNASLKVRDARGRESTATLNIVAGNTRPTIEFSYPQDGSFFSWNEPIPFEVTVTDAEDGSTTNRTIPYSDVTIQPLLGHDTHAHPLDEYRTVAGTFRAPEGHGSDADNIFMLVEARYTDRGSGVVLPLTQNKLVRLNPRRLQAENNIGQSGVQVVNTADSSGGEDVALGAPGSYFALGHINLQNIDRIRARSAGAGSQAQLEIRLDAVDGPLLATLNLAISSSSAYVTSSTGVTDPSGVHDLYFVAKGPAASLANLKINYLDFLRLSNVAPTAQDDSLAVTHAGIQYAVSASQGVLANDSDLQNDVLFASLVTGPQFGTLLLRPSGAYEYKSNSLQSAGEDAFTYVAHDGVRASNPVTVRIRVLPAGDADSNGTVNLADFAALRNNFSVRNATYAQGDFDGDGDVDLADFSILRTNFGATIASLAVDRVLRKGH